MDMSDLDIYEEAVNRAAERMAHDIDTELLMELLGWNAIEVSTGTVYGSRYQTAKPTWDPDKYQSGYFNSGWNDMMEWCVENFGPTSEIWSTSKSPQPLQRWYANNSKFWFKNEADLMLFMLRWS